MADEMYYDENPGAGKDVPEDKADNKHTEDDGGETALIPKALLGGHDVKPGDEIIFQIVKLYEDEAEIRYAPAKKDDNPDMEQSKEELSSMAE